MMNPRELIGFSDSHSNAWTVEKLTSELYQLLQSQKKKHAILVADSFRSVVAINYASKFNFVAGLFLMNWIFDKEWLRFFQEKKFDLSSVTSYLASKDLNSQPEDERFKIRMLSFSDFYFDARDLLEGQKMLNGLKY